MELSLLLFRQIVVMLLMVAMGFFLVRKKILTSESSRVLSVICVYWINPCGLLRAMNTDYDPQKLKGLLVAAAAVTVILPLYILIARLLKRPLKLNIIEQNSLIYTNNGNLILPLVEALFGIEAVIYCCAYIVIQSFFIWTHGFFTLSGEKKVSLKKIFNRNILSALIGLFLFFTQIKLPTILSETIDIVGSSMGMANMFVAGMILGGVSLASLFTNGRYYLISGFKLLVCPMIAILLIAATGITRILPFTREVLMIVVMAAAAPIAMLIPQLVNIYRGRAEAEVSGSMTILSLLLCVITMPVMIFLFQVFC